MGRLGIVALFASVLVGCGGADIQGSQIGGNGPTSSVNTGDGGTQCVSTKMEPANPSTLAPCCQEVGGQGHCVDDAKVPASQQSRLSTCSGGGFCVPDSIIRSGGGDKPKSCTSLNGAAGACTSLCIPKVGMFKDLLPQADCAADERCAPCIDPFTMQNSGACDVGNECTAGPSGGGNVQQPQVMCPYVGPPIVDPSTLPSCAPEGGAHCLSKSLVPPAQAGDLAACATGLCVPDVGIASGGNFIPKTCTSLAGAEGRCLHVAIPQVASQKDKLPVDVCAAYERCAPCTDPVTGAATSACKQSCDPGPTKPRVVFQDCGPVNGATQGKCVPTTAVPADQAKNLAARECSQTPAATLCVPTEMLAPTFQPKLCKSPKLIGGTTTGVCLSDVLTFSFFQSLAIQQADCDNLHQCVPCKGPLGAATGAPGCPAQ